MEISLRKSLNSSTYNSGVVMASQLLLVPAFLHAWGSEKYGSWLVLSTLPSLLSLADIGLSNTLGNAVSIACEHGDLRRAENQINSVWRYQSALSLLLLVIALVLGYSLSLGDLLKNPWPRWEFNLTFVLLCTYAMIALQTGLISAMFRAAHRYHTYLAWTGHGRLAEVALTAFLLLADGGAAIVATGMVLVRLATAVVLYRGGARALPELRFSLRTGRWRTFAAMLPNGLACFSMPVANAFINQLTVIAVNQRIGPAGVVTLNVARQLARVFQQGTSILQTALQPEITRAYAQADAERIRRLQTLAIAAAAGSGGVFVAGLAWFGPQVIAWWTGKHLGIGADLPFVCGLEAVTFGVGALCSLVPWSTNHVKELSLIYIIANVAAFGVTALLMQRLGVIVVPAAFAVAGVAYCATGWLTGRKILNGTKRVSALPTLPERQIPA